MQGPTPKPRCDRCGSTTGLQVCATCGGTFCETCLSGKVMYTDPLQYMCKVCEADGRRFGEPLETFRRMSRGAEGHAAGVHVAPEANPLTPPATHRPLPDLATDPQTDPQGEETEIFLNFRAGHPTANGRIYPKDALKAAFDRAIAQGLPVLDINCRHQIGKVLRVREVDGDRLLVKARIRGPRGAELLTIAASTTDPETMKDLGIVHLFPTNDVAPDLEED